MIPVHYDPTLLGPMVKIRTFNHLTWSFCTTSSKPITSALSTGVQFPNDSRTLVYGKVYPLYLFYLWTFRLWETETTCQFFFQVTLSHVFLFRDRLSLLWIYQSSVWCAETQRSSFMKFAKLKRRLKNKYRHLKNKYWGKGFLTFQSQSMTHTSRLETKTIWNVLIQQVSWNVSTPEFSHSSFFPFRTVWD